MSDLGPLSEIVCVQGESFTISGPTGDVEQGDHGVYVRDTRFLSRLALTVEGARPSHLSGASVGGQRAVFHAYLPSSSDTEVDPTISVTRRRAVDGGLRETLELANHGSRSTTLEVVVRAATDFAYIFDVKHGLALEPVEPTAADDRLTFERPGGTERTVVSFAGAHADGDRLRRSVTLAPGETCYLDVEVACRDHHGEVRPGEGAAAAVHAPVESFAGPQRPEHPSIDCSDTRFSRLLLRSLADLDSLVLRDPEDAEDRFLAAGSPWFLTLFGRDSIWSALMALPHDPGLARGTLRALARRQGTSHDEDTEEQPGKILHEVRRGALADRGDLPPFYYGTVDATPLFVVLAHEAWRWGLPDAEVEALLPHVEAALAWMRDHGDPDGDGFLRYVPGTGRTLANQGWKDSHDGVRYRDGRIAVAPLALCEVQAYAYDAARRGAALLDRFGRPGGDDWRAWADGLRARFRAAFWVEDEVGPYPAIAVDGDGQPVDGLASNMGHLLGTGLLDADESAAVADRLVRPGFASGWGLRTLSDRSGGYNPLSYHCGTVWPHDTAIAVWGLARDGHGQAAATLLEGLVRAAPTFNFRLPELFTGYDPDRAPTPVPYPSSCRPQAWAAGGAMLLARALFGIEADLPHRRLTLRPLDPAPFERLELTGIPIGNGCLDVCVHAGRLTVDVHDLDVDVVVEHPA